MKDVSYLPIVTYFDFCSIMNHDFTLSSHYILVISTFIVPDLLPHHPLKELVSSSPPLIQPDLQLSYLLPRCLLIRR